MSCVKMEMMMLRVLVVMLTVLGIGTIKANGEQFREFKDWSVNCSVGLICTMEVTPEGKKIYSLGFKRRTAASAPLSLVISLEGELVEGSDLFLRVDNLKSPVKLPYSDGKFNGYEWEFPLGDQIDALIPALKSSRAIMVQATTDKGRIGENLSLSGVVASMLFIDEMQGRVGKRDALQARGDGEPMAVQTRVVELTAKTQLPEQVRIAWVENFAQCGEVQEDIISNFGAFRVNLDKESSLFLLPCGDAGAYNLPFIAIIQAQDDGAARQLAFPVMGTSGPTVMDTAYNVNWDDKKSQLDAFFKGRGIGDCGSKQIWQWSGEDAFGEFELLEERVKDDCDEKHDDFPVIWPIK